ncbi:MAG: 4Fe-4S binding protein [Peptococcaceae bacterium]|jgi:iron only hydrogenase large subunit-like protein/uncharacterized Fe-S cluster-containing protein|nr:4Fe-4S binding protein [Peptococcaceae bacterium]
MPEYLKLKQSNCKNCYKCIRHCPVKSIQFSGQQANIIDNECVLCGQCFVVCPQNAKEIRDDVAQAQALLAGGAPVYASVAPSFAANFPGATISGMTGVLRGLGFAGAEETAVGATMVKALYDEMIEREAQEVIISTCCPTVNLLVQKYYPAALPYMAPVLSPMQAHCLDLRRRYPGAKTVFIGPCIAKKAEAESGGEMVDCVLTFEELSRWLGEGAGELAAPEAPNENSRARFFPTVGGILRVMEKRNHRYAYIAVDGLENCERMIADVLRGKTGPCFIEMSACAGSCVGGPAMSQTQRQRTPVRDYIAIANYAGSGDFPATVYPAAALAKTLPSLAARPVALGTEAINAVLAKIGKTKPEDELNCGSCGYNTCREKARAVLEGKATLTMCLPYLKERAESFSDSIIGNTPNGIVVLNESFEVQQINAAACRLMNIRDKRDIMGDHVVRILDPTPFIDAGQKREGSFERRVYLADYQKYVDQTVIYDREYHIIICIMRDVTDETLRQSAREEFNRQAVEITDKVIEKQMRAVQEIASLLGETTAETKVALTKLKESLSDA